MPTTKPRIQITLPDELHASIATIARLNNVPVSRFITDILISQQDVIDQVANLMLEAMEASQKLGVSGKIALDMLSMRVDHSKHQLRAAVDELHGIVSDANQTAPDTAGGGLGRGRTGRGHPLAINKGVKKGGKRGVDKDYRPAMPKAWKDL